MSGPCSDVMESPPEPQLELHDGARNPEAEAGSGIPETDGKEGGRGGDDDSEWSPDSRYYNFTARTIVCSRRGAQAQLKPAVHLFVLESYLRRYTARE
jgi:hypothetical protein